MTAIVRRFANREYRSIYQQLPKRKEVGDTPSNKRRDRVHAALEEIRKRRIWFQNGGYADVTPEGFVLFVDYSDRRDHERNVRRLCRVVELNGGRLNVPVDDVVHEAFLPVGQKLVRTEAESESVQLPLLDSNLDIIRDFHPPSEPSRESCDEELPSKLRAGYGKLGKPTSFGAYARRSLLEAGQVMDRHFVEPDKMHEVTCTLPGSTDEAMLVLAANSGWIIDRFTKKLYKLLGNKKSKKGADAWWFYVWEWQKRGALHLHFAFGHDDKERGKEIAESLLQYWWDLLKYLSEKNSVDLFARSSADIRKHTPWVTTWKNSPHKWQGHTAPIQKSLAAYFSKYAGKSCEVKVRKSSAGNVSQPSYVSNAKYHPVRWWGSSRAVKNAIKAERQEFKFEGTKEQELEVLRRWNVLIDEYEVIRKFTYEADISGSRWVDKGSMNGVFKGYFEKSYIGKESVVIYYLHTDSFIALGLDGKSAWELIVQNVLQSLPVPDYSFDVQIPISA